MADARESRFAESIAWWRLETDRADLATAATQALVEGLDSQGLRELAGLQPTANSFDVDSAIAHTEAELSLEDALRPGTVELAARRLARRVFIGDMTERELTSWAYRTFTYDTDSALIQSLVRLDDEFIAAESGRGVSLEAVNSEVRSILTSLLNMD